MQLGIQLVVVVAVHIKEDRRINERQKQKMMHFKPIGLVLTET